MHRFRLTKLIDLTTGGRAIVFLDGPFPLAYTAGIGTAVVVATDMAFNADG